MVRFSASQSVTIAVPTQPLSVEDYLSEPERLVYALVEDSQVEILEANLFRVKVRPIKFLSFNIQPVCDIEVWLEGETVRLRSNRCEIENYEAFNEKFSLNMQGYLLSQSIAKGDEQSKNLRGQANLIVSVDLPQALKFTPKPLLERTGNSLLNGILITLKQRLMRQLIANYCAWASSSPPQVSSFS
ncbi:MAG: DUF1997 domain-containing protein [Cyanobacteria bacterium P01_D01_bin.36]|mgnify:CR=1 FL=1